MVERNGDWYVWTHHETVLKIILANFTTIDNPFTDLYETEEQGGYPGGLLFKARPVVGGHFAFLALERACGGQAASALSFLDAEKPPMLAVEALLDQDAAYGLSQQVEVEL